MKRLNGVKHDSAFRLYKGGTIHSLYDLAEAFASMPAETFRHHVTETRNDFASWVRDVFEDSALASKLNAKKTKGQMESAVRQRIKELEHELMPAHASARILKSGMLQFILGFVIGFVAGMIICSFL